MKRGFTLIELLVVVLIIGILAAIALPQYQKAVERSRMAEAIQVLGNFAQAQSIYYMQHNNFAADLDELNEGDITLPAPGDTFDYDAGVINASFAFLDAVRHNGIYQGGRLSIEVNPDGSIHKICEEPANQTGFCTMAESAGYQRWEGGGGDEPISAGFTVSCEGGVLVNGQCMYY